MLIDPKIPAKLARLEHAYEPLRFTSIKTLQLETAVTMRHLRQPPGEADELTWQSAAPGHSWGRDFQTAWFRTNVAVPQDSRGPLFLRIETGAPESLLYVNTQPYGVFDSNHPVRLLNTSPDAGETFQIYLEAYAGHSFPGTQPFDGVGLQNDGGVTVKENGRTVGRAELVAEQADVSAFIFELRTLRQLAESLDECSLRRGRIWAGLKRVFELVPAKPEEAGERIWRPTLAKARDVMKPLLSLANGPTAPLIGIIGHSHIDTAWLWPLRETHRKLARTFSSVLSLMDQYPEFKFTQSAAYHADVVRQLYPALFERIQKRVKEGRWEINGAMWIEPDCNIPNGESLVRQCLFGQRATREFFGVTSDTLWQPDVFGYSAALPQILRQAGVEYFCTTKIAWNDTNKFPYDTFHWRGIDGTGVLAHFNTIHCTPDPKTLTEQWKGVQHNDVQDRRLMAFGYGDGGGGPMAEMIEMARLSRDLEGCPKAEYRSISQFMEETAELPDLPEWNGELYLELHRGTLTSIAAIKRGNRECEFLLRDAELTCALASIDGAPYPHAALRDAWKIVLLNQFHDILPGSSIAEVNDEAIAAYDDCRLKVKNILAEAQLKLGSNSNRQDAGRSITLLNSFSWDRCGEFELCDIPADVVPGGDGVTTQSFVDVAGHERHAVSGLSLPALGCRSIALIHKPALSGDTCFEIDGDEIRTPFARVRFGHDGEIRSFFDVQAGRELVRPGSSLNQFLIGEDVPNAWDNWDIDRDQQLKLRPSLKLIDRQIASKGPLQLRLRSRYAIGDRSTITQDVVFHSTTPRVDFDTRVEWFEKYQLLKIRFALDLLIDTARHETQFGHVTRSVTDNTSWDRAQFDVCAHKWTDLSETHYGVAMLNDCKYGCTVRGGEYRLTLIKSGRHPDPRGDEGVHRFAYAMLPHADGFSVPSVVRPAYEFNLPPRVLTGAPTGQSLLAIDNSNVIVEAVKFAEDRQALVIRLYEASRTSGHVTLRFNVPIGSVAEANLLEEPARELPLVDNAVTFQMRAFEIKTLICDLRRAP